MVKEEEMGFKSTPSPRPPAVANSGKGEGGGGGGLRPTLSTPPFSDLPQGRKFGQAIRPIFDE